MKRARLVLASLFLLGLWGSAPTVKALAPAAPRWPEKAQIRVWIDPKGAPPGALDMVGRAVKTWARAAQGLFALTLTSAERGAAVRVRFIEDPSLYGETAPHADRTGRIVSAEVNITGTVAGDPLDERIVLYLTALHELGHAWGLEHTDRFDDIMYGFRLPGDGERYFAAFRRRVTTVADIGFTQATGLSLHDLAALRKLYER